MYICFKLTSLSEDISCHYNGDIISHTFVSVYKYINSGVMTAEPQGIVLLWKSQKLFGFILILNNLNSPQGQSAFFKSRPWGKFWEMPGLVILYTANSLGLQMNWGPYARGGGECRMLGRNCANKAVALLEYPENILMLQLLLILF